MPENPDANWRVSRLQRGNAKRLRRTMTDAERMIWYAVKANRTGLSFRRQSPIGPYIVDFVCHGAGLVIEVDGAQHFEGKGLAHDKRREAFLNARGFRVLRFNNIDVLTNREGVLDSLYAALRGSPSPPSPASGEEIPRSAPDAQLTIDFKPHLPAVNPRRFDTLANFPSCLGPAATRIVDWRTTTEMPT